MTDTQNSTVSVSREDLAILIGAAGKKERISIRRHEVMFKLRAILAQPAEQQDEPVAYQYRERPCWVEGNLFSPWAPCDKGFHDSVLKEPLKLKFQREARALYLRPAAQAVKLPDRARFNGPYLHDQHSAGWNACLEAVAKLNGIEP